MKVVNLVTIIDMQSWCKTWPPKGSSRIRAKQKLLRKLKGACKSSWSRRGNQKSFTLTILWNLARLVKIFPGIIHRTSTPHRSETNGIAERAVRTVKEGTSAVLLRSGVDENWWADSLECFSFLRSIQDLLSDGKTPYERRFGATISKDQSFRLVHWLSISLFLRKTSQESINLERKSYLDLFLGYALYAVRIWKGDIMVADIEELETMDASAIHSKRLIAKEVIFHQQNEKFIFPVADGRIKFVGGDQELRTSTLIREHPIRGEGQRDFLRESEWSPPPPPQDSHPDDGEARNDFWYM